MFTVVRWVNSHIIYINMATLMWATHIICMTHAHICVYECVKRLGENHFLQYSRIDTRWRQQPIDCCHIIPAARDEKAS